MLILILTNESEDDDSEDEDDEDAQARRLLSEQIRDLETAVVERRTLNEIASSGIEYDGKFNYVYISSLISKPLETLHDALNLKKLAADLEMKFAQQDEL